MTQIASKTTHTAHPAFQASQQLGDNLQQMLVDLTDLHLQGKQAHWNVVGKNFRDLHLQLDEVIEAARGFSDTIAERMRALHALPDGRSDVVAGTTTLPEFPQGEIDTSEVIDLITERIDVVAATCREVHDAVDEEDPTTADILHAILERLEQLRDAGVTQFNIYLMNGEEEDCLDAYGRDIVAEFTSVAS